MSHPHRSLTVVAIAAALLFTAPLSGANTAGKTRTQPTSIVTKDNDNLWNLGAPYDNYPRVTRQQWMVATLRRNPDAFLLGNMHRLRTQVPLILPTPDEVAAEDLVAAEALITRHYGAMTSTVPMAPLPPLARPGGDAPAAVSAPTPAASAPTTAPVPAAGAASAAAGAEPGAAVPAAPAVSKPAPPIAVSSPAASVADAPASAPLVALPASAPADLASAPSAATPASAASAATLPPATSVVRATPDMPAPEGPARWLWWIPLIGGSLAVAFSTWALYRSRTTGRDFSETISTFFQETVQLVRKSTPKVISVSTAGADMARSVEKLASTSTLVRSAETADEQPAHGTPQADVALKLDMARAQLELGRHDAAMRLLAIVLRDGDAAAQQVARQLMGPPSQTA